MYFSITYNKCRREDEKRGQNIKFFGGILIGAGIFILILAFLGVSETINFGEFKEIFYIILIISGGLAIGSGIFHLEKS